MDWRKLLLWKKDWKQVTKFVFPQLVSLSLELMPDLKCFYPGKHTIECPSLKQLMIFKCDKVKIVASNELNFPNTDGLGYDVPIRQPSFEIEKVWTCTCFFVDMDIKCLHCIAFILDGHCSVDNFFFR